MNDQLCQIEKNDPIQEQDQAFEQLLQFLKHNRGFDFTGYKRGSLQRRMIKRMLDVGCGNFQEYVERLERHPGEFAELFNTLLINVTSFFRNGPAWESLHAHLVDRLHGPERSDDPIRVWTAACASGEETYTAAILLAETLGIESFTRRVRIYATDVDDHALVQAREGVYSAQQVEDVPAPLRRKYFLYSNGRFIFRADLRRSVIFGRHNLVEDAPISRLDLLICRNALMYFNAELQARILARFHFGLRPTGCLFLGKAEMLLSQGNLFRPIDLRHRLFEKLPSSNRALNGVQCEPIQSRRFQTESGESLVNRPLIRPWSKC